MPDAGPRVALIHATPVAIAPVHQAFAAHWPEAATFDLLESALSLDAQSYPPGIGDFDSRFRSLSRYARDIGARGILFTCSAFGSHIEAVARELAPLPVLKPNEAMFLAALGLSKRIAMIATFGPSVPAMQAEFEALAAEVNPGATLSVVLAEGALEALRAGDGESHDARCAAAAREIAGAEVLLLAQFSTARAQARVAEATGLPTLTSPESAVRRLRDWLS